MLFSNIKCLKKHANKTVNLISLYKIDTLPSIQCDVNKEINQVHFIIALTYIYHQII